ncbi:FbpB family small basic protein [Radiobacillus deserti]|uniref:FbpB family small basic protein n=1 Tax=Radiobacillus deserti TaxID=2594883 RepID=A0A516KFX4_9BACI|nr:FbpB family small basic protein [Radiobacillus deserti]QDP40294.1 FbpB family small basic protein [Radiobacillus deserti]
MSFKKKPIFEELVEENRKQILSDVELLEEIDEKLEQKWESNKS